MDTLEQGCRKCRFQPITLCLSLAIITFSLYLPTLGFDFIHLDDGVYVKNNPFVQHGISFNSVIYALTTTEVSYWHPLTWISHMLDCELFGMDAGGHHFVNVLIHTVNSILLFLVLRSMTGATWKSFFVAALFAWHPLGVETVAWISERKNLLCTLFWILAIWSHWRYAINPCAKRNLLTGLFVLMAFMAKPMAVTLPFALLLMDIWPLKRFPKPIETHGSINHQAGKLLLEKTTLFFIAFFICILTIYAQKNAGAISDLENLPILPRITNTFIAYSAYLGKMVWPVDLAILYPYTGQLRLGPAILCALGLLAITGFVLRLWKKQPWHAVGWFWFIGTLIPMIGLLQVGRQSMADRYTYLPLIGIYIMIAWGLEMVAKKHAILKSVVLIGTCIILAECLYLTRIQIFRWKDSIALFTHTLRVADEHYTSHFALACAYFDEEQYENAEKHLSDAIRLSPESEHFYIKLGLTYARQGKFDKALSEYKHILQMNPDNASVCYYLGMLYEQEHKFESALEYYHKALTLKPKSKKIPNRIAWLLSTCPDPSIRNGQKAIQLAKPLEDAITKKIHADYLCTLAAAYAETGQFNKAVATANKALNAAKSEKNQNDKLITLISNCLEHYRQNQPCRDISALND